MTYLCAIAMLLVVHSCDDNFVPESENPVTRHVARGQNPFSIEMTTQALEKLSAANPNARGQALVSTTHEYIQFIPSTVEQLTELEKLGYQLFETPLDENVAAYQAANPGSVPVTPLGIFYTLKPIGYQLSALAATTPRVTLANLVLFDENAGDEYDGARVNALEAIPDPWEPAPVGTGYCYDENYGPYECDAGSYVPSNNPEHRSAIHRATVALLQAGVDLRELYNERMRLAGHPDEVEEASAAGRIQGYNPAGRIVVFDNSINQDVPVKNVSIKTQRWFKLDNTTTDASGNFYIDKSYRKKARVIVKFTNNYAAVRGIGSLLKVWEYAFALQHDLGTFERSAMQSVSHTFPYEANTDTRAALQWVAAHFMNTLFEFRQYCASEGLPMPPSNLNVWVSDRVTQAASAPMLRAITSSSDIEVVNQYLFPNSTTSVLKPLKIYRPDITMRIQDAWGNTRDAANVSATFFHELAHSIHFGQVGSAYWAAEILYTVAHNGYGQKNDSGAERAAVVEAWGFYLGPTFNIKKYMVFATPAAAAIRNIDLRMLEVQSNDNNVPFAFDGSVSRGWIPAGFLHDCTDVGEPLSTLINDQVSGYTPKMLFRGFTSSITHVQPLKGNILSNNGNNQATQMNNLLTGYGY